CTGCMACVLNCPTRAISMVYGNILINYSRCIECYTCIEVCNFDALEVYNLNLKRRFE
ncbi:MAG TPA: 4Fe-4S dicluster domain-containing protein, partial [candidate division WOR-3 bacterium]|nr:4Fe-4S dicluster domain-containing protein [candidate division WOR-3 bacterium]